MNIQTPLQLLGGISPETFMRRYWHKKPLVIRQAIPGFSPLLERLELFELAAQEEVESRLVVQTPAAQAGGWKLKHGPFARKALPPLKQAGWTLLVQGVDTHDERVHRLLNEFRFVPDARLDDLMISYATDQGGVGPHFDSYDVFLLQAHGRRQWRIGRQKDLSLQPNMPLKILANFEPEEEFILEPGDMLYLPPNYAHDGIAHGECMTYSIGFRSPSQAELAQELLQRLAEYAADESPATVYADPQQVAVDAHAEMPPAMVEFARTALQDALKNPKAIARALGEYLTEPKANVWFDPQEPRELGAIQLDRCTRMLYDAHHVFINGESYLAAGRDAQVIRRLADQRELGLRDMQRLGREARALVQDWCDAGWLHPLE